ncbi:MAG: DUF6273 domain-containing protein [Christensenellaceae bacterium]|jgi:hypothetical protein|nr:DUF6273 domain-containing protein [Christensenellaceae bacterium]
MPQAITNLAVTAKVKDPLSTYYGSPIVWQIGDKNHAGYPANSVTLVSDKIIKIVPVDAKESGGDSNRQNYGNNRYALANLRQWLNKAAASWYQSQHTYDRAPSSSYVSYNPYDTQAGFLSGFSAQMIAAILDTTLTVAQATVDGGGSETVTDKVFLLSKAEVGLGAENSINEGSLLAMFSGAASRIAYPTAAAVSNSTYTSTSLSASQPWYWWLRSPYATYSYYVRGVNTSGAELGVGAHQGTGGLRPALNLPSSILVSDSPDSDGVYSIVWNQNPTNPPSISVPDTVRSGRSTTIQWTASTDPEGNAITYKLECSVNGAAYAQIYSGSGLSYAHSITSAMNTVQYRVKAVDSNGGESGYTASTVRQVVHNVDPTISGQDTDLGTITSAPSTSFSVDDQDTSDELTVEKKIDDATVDTIEDAVRGQTYNWAMTDEQFAALSSGTHTMKIVVSDTVGNSATRTITFTRAVTKIELKVDPIDTDAKAEKILISMRYYASDSDVTLKVCNNANDANPTWESANNSLKHIFSNTTKTAASWAVGVWVIIETSESYPEIYCNSLNGSYI